MPGDLTVGERSLPAQRDLPPGVATGAATGAAWRLDVLEGANRDAVLELLPGNYRFGADRSAEILLADPEAARAGLVLHIPSSGVATLRAEAAGVTFGDRPLKAGTVRTIPRGGMLRLGATVLRLTPPAAHLAAMDGRSRSVRWRVAAAGSAAILVVALAAFGPRLLSDPMRPALERRDAVARPETVRPDRDAARAALGARLEAANLGPDRLRVSDGANGALLVEGRLNAEETTRFGDVRRWYDSAHGAGPALVPRLGVEIGPARPVLRIRAVALSPVPYVIAGDGERYGEGAVLEDGWVVESIAADRVVLRRGAETSVVTL